MITNHELALYLQEYLVCDSFQDYAPNGLQIEGKEEIQVICTAVSASLDVIETAVALQADALLVHHGFFWKGENPNLVSIKRHRIKQLLAHDINLYGYHLPLDCHLDIGNNACIAELLNIKEVKTHSINKVKNILWSGKISSEVGCLEFSSYLEEKFKRAPFSVLAGNKPIETIAWCSGAAQDYIKEAAALGVDAFISGEISERTFHEAKELGVHYFACGHYATERYGIQALGHHLTVQYQLRHQFIESPNPV